MQEITAILNRLSIAVQFAVVICLFAYFLLLWQMVKLREVRLWTAAWLANAVALAAVFVHAYASIPPLGHRITLVLYLAGKATFAFLIVAGARHHLRPGVEPRVSPLALGLFIAAWSLILGFAVPSLWQGQLAESALVAMLLLVGGVGRPAGRRRAHDSSFEVVPLGSRSCARTWSESMSRSWRRPRCSRDMTVPIGVSRISAISL